MTEKQIISPETQRREYELAFLLVAPEEASSISKLITKHGGEIIHESQVTSLRLAYPIRKQATAFFGFCHFVAPHSAAQEIGQGLKIDANVLRSLLLTPPPKAEARAPRSSKKEEPKVATPSSSILTNEALEQKLEEILK